VAINSAIEEERQRIEWILAETPSGDQVAVLKREIIRSKLPPDVKQAIAGYALLGIRAGMASNRTERLPTWVPKAGAVSAFATIASVFYLIVRPEGLATDRHPIFDIWMVACTPKTPPI
jgi:hypothetical protein